VLAPERNAVIVANPADNVIYYYTEGMAAPMGDFQNYRREPRAVLVVDRSLRENEAGIYSTTVKLPASGKYDIAFLADAPRVAHCFEASAEVNPLLKVERQVALRLEPQKGAEAGSRPGVFAALQADRYRHQRAEGRSERRHDVDLSAGWQRRDLAKWLGGGIYEVKLNVPEAGAYMVFVQSLSQGVSYKDLPQLMLEANDAKALKISTLDSRP